MEPAPAGAPATQSLQQPTSTNFYNLNSNNINNNNTIVINNNNKCVHNKNAVDDTSSLTKQKTDSLSAVLGSNGISHLTQNQNLIVVQQQHTQQLQHQSLHSAINNKMKNELRTKDGEREMDRGRNIQTISQEVTNV